MKWRDFKHGENEYSLGHVHPFEWEFTAPAATKRPERKYKLQVTFSMHTFTRRLKPVEYVPDLLYRDNREVRAFDFVRFELSKKLPEIVRELGDRRCYQTHHGNFFTIELADENGQLDEYEVYFKVSRASRKGWLNLYVQSAYIRESGYQKSQPKKDRIGFQVIAYNTTNDKEIKPGK